MWQALRALILLVGVSSIAVAGSYKTNRLADDGIHDPENDAINILQEPGEAMVDFPLDKRGKIDWVQAIRDGQVNPRQSISGDESEGETMTEMDMTIIMKQTSSMPYVSFPHLAHTQWLTCSSCHPKIFEPQYEANPVTMEKILKGEFCGRCHDKVSFGLLECERCHSVSHDKSPDAWWNKKK